MANETKVAPMPRFPGRRSSWLVWDVRMEDEFSRSWAGCCDSIPTIESCSGVCRLCTVLGPYTGDIALPLATTGIHILFRLGE